MAGGRIGVSCNVMPLHDHILDLMSKMSGPVGGSRLISQHPYQTLQVLHLLHRPTVTSGQGHVAVKWTPDLRPWIAEVKV